MKHASLPTALFALAAAALFGQMPEGGQPSFDISYEGPAVRFTPRMPPLAGIPGAPAPFYSYHWEFGDGNFSREESPLYQYADARSHVALMAATASYDDDDLPPPMLVATVLPPKGFEPGKPEFRYAFPKNGAAIGLRASQDARANEEMAIILSYQNTGKAETGGQLHLFFNEKAYPKKHFEFRSARAHFGEVDNEGGLSENGTRNADYGMVGMLPLVEGAVWSGAMPFVLPAGPDGLAEEARKSLGDERSFTFTELRPGERRNLFTTFLCTPGMLKDTSAILHIRGLFVPESPLVAPASFDLEVPVVASHDPNLIAVSDTRANFRHIDREKLGYTVRFQNNGEGPAKKIELTVDIPPGLDLGKVRPTEWYPPCPICPPKTAKLPRPSSCLDTLTTGNRLVFTFNGVHLPGSRQKGIDDRDSTKGFVKYTIEPGRRISKRAFRSQAHIVFDKNPPVTTNFSKTRFKPGLSPGLKAGTEFPPEDPSERGWFAGASLAPYKPWRAYPQVEVLLGRGRAIAQGPATVSDTVNLFNFTDLARDSVTTVTTASSERTRYLELPVLLRKNLTGWLGIGIGGSARLFKTTGNATETRMVELLNYFWVQQPGSTTGQLTWDGKPVPLFSDSNEKPISRQGVAYTAFADLTIGAVRAGPSLGLRAGWIFDHGRQPFAQASIEVKF